MSMKTVLIVEDHKDLADLIKIHLSDLGHRVLQAADGQAALVCTRQQRFDLIILDLMLPRVDGLEVCRQIRQQQDYTPILMLTSKSSELDRVLGLEVGADDYVTKPFSTRELMARVKAMFRRVDAFAHVRDAGDSPLSYGALEIDVGKRQLTIAGRQVDLTVKEFDLLLQFVERPGRVYSRSQLLDAVWGYGHEGYEHTVNSHINRLRAKIETDSAHPEYILTVWGMGYKFNDAIDHEARPQTSV